MLHHMFRKYSQDRNIVINSSEFAASQVNSILEAYYPEVFKEHAHSIDTASGMNNIVIGNMDCITDYQITQFLWAKTVESLNLLILDPTCNVMLNIIVNDFMLKPEERQAVKSQFPLHFPAGFRETLTESGMTYLVDGNQAAIRIEENRVVPLRFVFESTLRNRARKLLKSLLKACVILESREGLFVRLDNDALKVISSANFRYRRGEMVFLTNQNRIPVCSSILLTYFWDRKDRLIINIADYNWKCGYRRGALALYNVFPNPPAIHNFFYITPDDHALVYDVFLRRR
jgi:hypothetical protein